LTPRTGLYVIVALLKDQADRGMTVPGQNGRNGSGRGRGRVKPEIVILLKKVPAKNGAKIFRSQLPHNRFSQHG